MSSYNDTRNREFYMVIKKVIAKKATKKTGGKTSGKKKVSIEKSPLSVSGEMCFWVNKGPILSNIKDLHTALTTMTSEQFAHHVGKNKNDFAVWVEGVLFEKNCATKLKMVKTVKEAQKVVEVALKAYA